MRGFCGPAEDGPRVGANWAQNFDNSAGRPGPPGVQTAPGCGAPGLVSPETVTPALFLPLLVYAVVLALHLALPGRWIDGYVIDPTTGRPLRYRLNGLRVLLATVALYVAACWLGAIPWDFFYLHRWEMVAGACALGLLFTLLIVLPAPAGPLRGPRPRATPESAMGQRAPRRQDVPVPGRRRDAAAQPALVHRPSPADPSGGSVRRRDPLHAALQLLRGRVPALRRGAPLHLRPDGGAGRLQARLGLPGLLSVLLPHRPVGTG